MTDLPLPEDTPRLPNAHDLARYARKHAVDAIDVLVDCMGQTSPASGSAARITAAKAVLDRAYGAPQSLEAKFRLLPEDMTFAHTLTDEDQPDE